MNSDWHFFHPHFVSIPNFRTQIFKQISWISSVFSLHPLNQNSFFFASQFESVLIFKIWLFIFLSCEFWFHQNYFEIAYFFDFYMYFSLFCSDFMEIDKAIRDCSDRRLKTKYNNAVYVIQRALALYKYGFPFNLILISSFAIGLILGYEVDLEYGLKFICVEWIALIKIINSWRFASFG